MKKNICLSIETTGRHLGIALFQFDTSEPPRRLETFYKEALAQQSDLLVPTMDALMRRARVARENLALISVNVGPGSFTGVRMGMAAARMLAQGLKLPLVGVSALEAMAWEKSKVNPRAIIVPHIPALVGETYFAAYQGGKILQKPCWETHLTFRRFVSKNKNTHLVTAPPHPNVLARIAIERYLRNPRSASFHYENAQALYLQPSWAERANHVKRT